MKTAIENSNIRHNGRTMAGVILLLVGGMLLVNQLDLFFIPNWIFSWPMWLIGWGLYMGAKYNFRKPIWIVMLFLGVAFLFTENIPNAEGVVWPVAIISYGIWMVLKNRNQPAIAYPGSANDQSFGNPQPL